VISLFGTSLIGQEGASGAEIVVSGHAVAAFLAYLLLLVAIGLYSSRFSSQGVSEFFVGGRRMNRFVVALSAVVSGRTYTMGASALWAV